MPCWLTSFATSRSIPLRSSLARAFAATSFVSAAKPTTKALVRRAATSARMSAFGVSSRVRSRLPLIFVLEACLAIFGDRGGLDHDRRAREVVEYRLAHVLGGLH